MDQKFQQLALPETEIQRLKDRIWQDATSARSNHDSRTERFRRYYRMWRSVSEEATKPGEEPPFDVPMLKWITFGHWSRCMQALLGDDAEIVGAARTPESEKIGPKAGAYMTWRVFEYMRATPQLSAWLFRAVLFGRAHAYCPYEQEFYWERNENGDDEEKLCYDGPRLTALWPSELILPAQDGVTCIDDFEWKIRRVRVTPQQLLDGERRGIYQGITENWDTITGFAEQRQEREYAWDDEKIDADYAEGVNHASVLGNRDSVEIWQWYGKWRLPKGKQDSRPGNLKRRQPQESELLVNYIPRAQLIVGVQDLRDLYPRSRKRTPFLDIGLVKDGSYWGPGLGELIEDLQRQSTANHKLFQTAGKLSVGPVVLYRAQSGFDPGTQTYGPFTAIPSEDPGGVNVLQMTSNLQFTQVADQYYKSLGELVSGVSNQTLGQSIDRPNAPRTATGQIALIEQGNVRASLDMTMLREDLSVAIEWMWALDREFAPESVFFRATEEDANGLFDTNHGFGSMTAQEREHNFDFKLKFATSVWSKEAKKQYMLALYNLSMQNPIIQMNPRACWVLLNRLWKAFGEDNFRDVVPEPPQLEQPEQPKTEWAKALRGEDIHVNPLDDDQIHLIDHRRRLEQAVQEEPDRRDPQAEAIMVAHILEHEQQRRQKMVLQAIVQRAQQEMQPQAGMSTAGQMPQFDAQPPQDAPQDFGGAPGAGIVDRVASLAGPAGLGGPQAGV